MIPFAQFGPDRSTFDANFADKMENVLPKASSYGPFPQFVPLSLSLAAAPRGSFLAYVDNGQYRLFVGTQTAIYMLDATTLGWINVSKAGGYNTQQDRKWSFTQFGNRVIATNGADPVQWINIDTPVQFADLPGSPPEAYYTGTLGDFVILANLTTDQRGIHWSGLNNSEWWTPRERSSDFQTFAEGGEIMGFTGGNDGCVIFHAESIREGRLALDTSLVLTFSQTVANHGCLAPRSVVQTGAGTFYLSDDGFYRYGIPPTPIGLERVDNFFLEDVDRAELFHVYGSEDPNRKIVYWAYKSNANPLPMSYDKVLLYHYGVDRWSLLRPGTILTGLIDAVTPGYTLDSLDSLGLPLDDLPFSLDSRAWSGSTPLIAAIDADFKFGIFSGSPLPATLQTVDVQLSEGKRTFVRGFRALCDAPMINGRVAVKDWGGAERTWKQPANASNATGLIPARASGRFHRFEINIPADNANIWEDIHGVEPNGAPEGER